MFQVQALEQVSVDQELAQQEASADQEESQCKEPTMVLQLGQDLIHLQIMAQAQGTDRQEQLVLVKLDQQAMDRQEQAINHQAAAMSHHHTEEIPQQAQAESGQQIIKVLIQEPQGLRQQEKVEPPGINSKQRSIE